MEVENIVIVTLRDAVSGAPIPSPNVTVADAISNSLVVTAPTNLAGTAVFLLPTGTYSVCQNSPDDAYLDSCFDDRITAMDGTTAFTPIAIGGGATRELSLPMHEGATVSGHLTDHETGLSIEKKVFMSLFSTSGVKLATLYTYTQFDGSFTVRGIVPGTYFVAAGADTTDGPTNLYTTTLYGGGECRESWLPCDFSAARAVPVPLEGVDGIDLSLSPGDIVSGTVYDRDSGMPIAGTAIYTCSNMGDGFFTFGPNTTTDSQGHFSLSHSDVYTMTFSAKTRGYVSSYWPSGLYNDDDLNEGSCAFALGRPLNGEPHHYSLDIYMPTVSPQGRFFGLAFIALSSFVYQQPTQATIVIFEANTKAVAATLHTDKNGAYVSPPLPAGYYVVTAYLDDGGACSAVGGPALPVCNDDRTFPSEVFPSRLDDGNFTEADLYWPQIEIFQSSFE
jgi:hypothetical protein